MIRRRSLLSANVTPLLDLYPGAGIAYSLRKLRTAYTGFCLQVQRSSDGAVQDIGFVDGFIDVASLLAFVGAGNGTVVIWYDQGLNGWNATQSTMAQRPNIVISGSFLGYIHFQTNKFLQVTSGGGLFRNVGGGSVFSVITADDTSTIGGIFNASINVAGSTARARIDVNNTSNRFRIGTRRLDGGATQLFTSNTDHNTAERVLSCIWDWSGGNIYMYENGANTVTDVLSSSGNTSNTDSGIVQIGVTSTATGNYFNGKIKEFVAYPVNNISNRVGIEANINSYW